LADTITDFDQALAERINVGALDAKTGNSTNDDFDWIGTDAFSNVAGQMRYAQQGGDTFIEGDVNGDGVADLVIRLTGLYTLSADDIIGANGSAPASQPVEILTDVLFEEPMAGQYLL
jgi:serralysin